MGPLKIMHYNDKNVELQNSIAVFLLFLFARQTNLW